jgi:hypothetical protein
MQEKIEKSAPAVSDKEIKHIEVAELEAPSKRIIEQIQDRIEKEEYGIIIGDDVSGRIPTLIIGGLIQKIMESERKFVPNITFIPGRLDNSLVFSEQFLGNLKDFLNKFGFEDGKKVLIVTDTVMTGAALATLTKSLNSFGIKYDIATIGIEGGGESSSFPWPDLFSGEYGRRVGSTDEYSSRTPLIYRNKSMSGVWKRYYEAESSKRMKDIGTLSEDEAVDIQDLINESREDVKILVGKLFEWYKGQYGKQE